MHSVDLHVHSCASDGTYTPGQLVERACEKGLAAFALTDHDTVDGLAEALACAKDKPVEVIPGIELSTEYHGKDIHIVGLFIGYEDPAFLRHLKQFCDSRDVRNARMAARLTDAGFPLTAEELAGRFPDAVITRAHFARLMLEKGYIRTLKEAFDKYIGDACPYFVPREKVTPADGVRLILEAGGVPILAHPILYRMDDEQLLALLALLTEAGLMGIEALYSTYSATDEARIRRIAAACGLLLSGGSDFHGANKPGLDLGCGYGRLFVPASLLEALRNARPDCKKAAAQQSVRKEDGSRL